MFSFTFWGLKNSPDLQEKMESPVVWDSSEVIYRCPTGQGHWLQWAGLCHDSEPAYVGAAPAGRLEGAGGKHKLEWGTATFNMWLHSFKESQKWKHTHSPLVNTSGPK